MSPTGLAAGHLRQQIYHALDNDMLDNANFIAGRLVALEPRNRDNHHLLALTYLRAKRFKAAHDFSHRHGYSGAHLGCSYVLAQACLELGLHKEGIDALKKCESAWRGKCEWKSHSETSRRHLPDAPAVWTLLGKLHNARGDARQAGDCWLEAHKSNPFMWDAFEGLCKIRADLKVPNMFKANMLMPEIADQKRGEPQIYQDEDARQPVVSQPNYGFRTALQPSDDPFATRADSGLDMQEPLARLKGKSTLTTTLRPIAAELDTPVAGSGIDDDVTMAENQDDTFHEPPAAPSRRLRLGQQFETSDRPRPPMLRGNPEVSEDLQQAPRKPIAGGQKRTISGAASQPAGDSSQPRRSGRLGTQTSASRTTRSVAEVSASTAGRPDRLARTAKMATGTKGRTGTSERGAGRVVSGNRKVLPPADDKEKEKRATSRTSERTTAPSVTSAIVLAHKHTQAPPSTSTEDLRAQHEAMSDLLDTFRQLAIGSYAIFPKFKSDDAIETFNKLPAMQRETPWVLAQLGKAYYEAAQYPAAEACYSRLLKLQPSRIEDMEIYSTVLWHMKQEVPLAYLSRTLHDTHFDAPQTWVALGNSYSLAREHDMAISAFKRATQLDQNFTYAHTLMGHEYMANEDYSAAQESFRVAIKQEPTGYGGWYGLGKCYEKMGVLEKAEQHYKQAAIINSSNSTLQVCIGVVLERLRNKEAALLAYDKALDMAPDSALARFKKARVLMHLRDYESALEELIYLSDVASDEANVHFLLGKCYKAMGHRALALKSFTEALNLDVKAAPFIKEEIEKLEENVDDSDDDD
ncbi:hypothetical protein DOTSEDRAFT_71372 [Dothistroma septosporum NZE10]|uniref:Uncharacterized protein n=1 Tax=Dothistroma septosporum (strain NZE10 / CBS 128990) TaxID=675120 RepID=N1PQI5_DOTSN|nr:hypothetical protein DOTSEDRAFT_71372 [Dothistroma septosporum NZE10]